MRATPDLIRRHIKHPVADITLFARCGETGRVRLAAVMYGTHDTFSGRKAELSDSQPLWEYAVLIQDFLDGKVRSLSRIRLFFDGCSEFRKRVLKAARKIPPGRTVSYKELAQMSGCPKAVRAVANVMRHNPFPLVIPCHRVIRSGGTIGGFGGKVSGPTIDLKRKLLAREGVRL
jgi:methylated-DNA-[protein]-cysteine S-methyltransferase